VEVCRAHRTCCSIRSINKGEYKLIFYELVPFIESEKVWIPERSTTTRPQIVTAEESENEEYSQFPFRKVYLSPSDPSLSFAERLDAPCSYGANMQAFEGYPNLNSSFSDGLSNTISFSEKYFRAIENLTPRPGGSQAPIINRLAAN